MATEVKVNREGEFGFQEVIGLQDGSEVITLSDGMRNLETGGWLWRITSSRTVPGDLDRAFEFGKLVSVCIKTAQRLNMMSLARNDIKDNIYYDVETERILILTEITSTTNSLSYKFSAINTDYGYENIIYDKGLDTYLVDKLIISKEESDELMKKYLQKQIDAHQNKIDHLVWEISNRN